ncbi:MAG TPA: arginine--tRNA ligase [Candidatus Saccharimonadia bacterium]|nr:arginine--tRNA ligase [Candidatus Saccharimonadia bacterium]
MITTRLINAIAGAIEAEFQLELQRADFEVTRPAEARFGDFSCNAAMTMARQLGLPPQQIAERLATRLATNAGPLVARTEVAGPGFINIWLTDDFWRAELTAIMPDYGRADLGESRRVQVEFISANPTGPTTIGNARGGFIGDVLSNVLAWGGYEVTREYYFNNAGTQIGKLLESAKMEAGLLPETDERQYRGEYIKELATEFKHQLATGGDEELKQLLANTILKRYIEPAVEAMGIHFDVWFNEKDLITDGRFDETLKLLDERGLVFKRDGATWLKTGELGDERGERVIIKSNGDPTYMAPDIAYHVDVFGRRGFDWSIKVLGPDHVAQFPSVYAAVHALFPDKQFTMAGYQALRIVKDGQEVKVSKRLGQFIMVTDLIQQVGLPVARFLTLMRSPDSHMDFDLDLATEQSAKNPYYYVMYAYARAHSILAKAAERGLTPAAASTQLNETERALVRAMTRLPELITEMVADYGVHRLTFFGLELAKLWTEFYEDQRIIDLPAEQAQHKLLVVQRFVVFMDVYWSLLGIEPQQRMEHE